MLEYLRGEKKFKQRHHDCPNCGNTMTRYATYTVHRHRCRICKHKWRTEEED